MLTEIEDKLVKILQERVEGIPKENVVVNTEPAKPPAIVISNLGFECENLGLVKNIDEGRIQLEETFSSDGTQTIYKLKEKPWQGKVQVESPPGTPLTEKKDYVVNYKEDSIGLRKTPAKGKNRVLVRYLSHKSTVIVRGLKVKATYAIDVWGADRAEADSIAEKMIKTLLTMEDKLAEEGIELKPLGGETLPGQEKEKSTYNTERLRLEYLIQRELLVKEMVPPIENIEISSKNVWSAK